MRRALVALALLLAPAVARAQFTIPNYPSAAYPAQAAPDKVDFDVLVAGITGNGVLTGCACSPQGSPDMTVAVAAGTTMFGNVVSTVSSGNATIGAADGTNPRFDLIVSAAGTKAVRAGTAAANPVFPNLTAGDVLLCAVYVPASITTIDSTRIVDKRVFFDYPLVLPEIANPSAPSAGLLFYGRKLGGRVLPKFIGPAGLDTVLQPALFGGNSAMYSPSSGTTVTGGWGTTWAKGASTGTVDTPTQTSGITNQIKRTRHRNLVTTTNQAMGIISTAAGMPMVWRGNAAGQGGFFFFARFIVTDYPAASIRIFCGLTAGTAEVVTSDTVAANTAGFWHDTTMAGTAFQFVTKDASTANTTSITSPTLAAGQGYDVYIFAKPNDSTLYFRVDDINGGTTLIDSSTSTNLPVSTTFLGPQCEISNGTANTTVNTVGIGVNRIYIESDR